MPEKSPPFFRENQESQPSQQSSQSSQIYRSGPNLILKEEILPPHFFYIDILFKFFRRASFFIVAIFGVMLIVNALLNLKLESQKKMTNQLADEVGLYTLTQKTALDIDKKTKFYDATLSQRHLLGDKASTVFSSLSPAVTINIVTVTPQKFVLYAEVPTPLDFAKLIASYLESDHVASVTLRSADLVANKNIFKISLEGAFK